jgi:hypothetical protein
VSGGDERDWAYAAEALRARIVSPHTLLARVADLPVDSERSDHIHKMLESLVAAL